MDPREPLIARIMDILMQSAGPDDMPGIAAQARHIVDSGAYGLARGRLSIVSPDAIRQLLTQGTPIAFIEAAAEQVAAAEQHPALRAHAQLRGMGFDSVDGAIDAEQSRASGGGYER